MTITWEMIREAEEELGLRTPEGDGPMDVGERALLDGGVYETLREAVIRGTSRSASLGEEAKEERAA